MMTTQIGDDAHGELKSGQLSWQKLLSSYNHGPQGVAGEKETPNAKPLAIAIANVDGFFFRSKGKVWQPLVEGIKSSHSHTNSYGGFLK